MRGLSMEWIFHKTGVDKTGVDEKGVDEPGINPLRDKQFKEGKVGGGGGGVCGEHEARGTSSDFRHAPGLTVRP